MRRRKFYICYSILFGILMLAMSSFFFKNGKTFLWRYDGTGQHLPSLIYVSEYLKELFSGKHSALPMVDFSLGQGLDVITTLNYYGFGDPLHLLSVFFSKDNMELLYSFLVILRMYLAGAAFAEYCFMMEQKDKRAVLLGTIMYVFSGGVLFAGVRHPFFLNAWIYLPLLLIAVERIIRKKKYGMFIGMVCLSLVSNFYFAYMNTALIGIYILFRVGQLKETAIKEKAVQIGKMIGAYLWGAAMSAAVFLPVVYGFMQNARSEDMGGYTASLLHYNVEYYQNFFEGFVSPKLWIGSWSIVSVASFSLLAVFAMFILKKIRLIQGFLLLTLFAIVPLFGKIFNGFGYVCNRWMYGYAFWIAFIVVVMTPQMLSMKKKQKIIMGSLSAVYAVCLCISNIDSADKMVFAGVICFAVTVVVWLCLQTEKLKNTFKYGILLSTTAAVILVNMFYVYDGSEGNYIYNFDSLGEGISCIKNTPVKAYSKIHDDSFGRVEQPWIAVNQAAVLKYYGNTFYYSIIPANISDYYKELGMNTLVASYKFYGQDFRAGVNALSSTKYYTVRKDQAALVPYGSEYVDSIDGPEGKVYQVYKNTLALPIGYTYQSYMTRKEYDALNPIEKQEALMQSALLENKEKTIVPFAAPKTHISELPYEIKKMKGVHIEDGKIIVKKRNAKLVLKIKQAPKSETYLSIKGFQMCSEGGEVDTIQVKGVGGKVKNIRIYGKGNNGYFRKEYHTVNLGYSEEGISSCTLQFPRIGTYTFDSIGVFSYPMQEYEEQVKRLGEEALTDVKVSDNKVEGNIEVSGDRWLQLSIPYSKGWKAYVDGKKTELSQSGRAYMGVSLNAGKHSVTLVYETPFLKIGLIISAIAVLSFVILKIKNRAVEWRKHGNK